jgi:primosomal protein N' (replication factor Y)
MDHKQRKQAEPFDLGFPGEAAMRVPVMLPYPFQGPFDYRVPRGMQLAPGDIVQVPLNRREEIGVVWDGTPDNSVGDNRLRPVSAKLELPPMR